MSREEIKDLKFLLRLKGFLFTQQPCLKTINGKFFTTRFNAYGDTIYFNKDTIYSKNKEKEISLKDFLTDKYGSLPYDKAQRYANELEKIASKYGLGTESYTETHTVVDDYDEYLGSVELEHEETESRWQFAEKNNGLWRMAQ